MATPTGLTDPKLKQALDGLVSTLKTHPRLAGAFIYGDVVRGEHRGPQTPVSVALVLEELGDPADAALADCLRELFVAHRFEPWLVLRAELARIGDVFPVKLFEIDRYGAHLCGEMKEPGVEHNRPALRLRVEQLARNALMRRRRLEFVQKAKTPARGNEQWSSQLHVLLAALDYLRGGSDEEALVSRSAEALGVSGEDISASLGGSASESTDRVLAALIECADKLEVEPA